MERENMIQRNEMQVEFDANSVNERFARVTAAAFVAQLNPTMDEVEDIKTAVSEAVTNAIIHGYDQSTGKVRMSCRLEGPQIHIIVEDWGKGIEDIALAKQPFYTTRPELERSGMGFAFMEAFMDDVQVESEVGKGTRVTMQKRIGIVSEQV